MDAGYTGKYARKKNRGRPIKSDGIVYRGLAKYRGIPSSGTDFQ